MRKGTASVARSLASWAQKPLTWSMTYPVPDSMPRCRGDLPVPAWASSLSVHRVANILRKTVERRLGQVWKSKDWNRRLRHRRQISSIFSKRFLLSLWTSQRKTNIQKPSWLVWEIMLTSWWRFVNKRRLGRDVVWRDRRTIMTHMNLQRKMRVSLPRSNCQGILNLGRRASSQIIRWT